MTAINDDRSGILGSILPLMDSDLRGLSGFSRLNGIAPRVSDSIRSQDIRIILNFASRVNKSACRPIRHKAIYYMLTRLK
jgi:hypothetical protein